MRLNTLKRKLWSDEILPIIMEYGIYLLAIFLFFHKGQSFRSLGLYIPPVALIIRSCLTRQWPFTWRDPLFLSIVALCTFAIISAALSNETLSFLVWIKKGYLKVFLIFIVIATAFNERNVLKKLIMLLSILTPLFIAMTFYDYITKALAEDGAILFDNVRKYNSVLAFLLPFIPFAILTTTARFAKIFWILTLCIGITALLLTGFRGGWISLIVSMIIWGVWLSFKRIRRKMILIPIGIFVTAFIILTMLPSSHVSLKVRQGFSTVDRYEWIWKPYIHLYRELPVLNKILGSGMTNETMNTYHQQYRKTLEDFPDRYVPLNPHNQYLNILFRQGILGLILYISLISIFLLSMATTIRKRNMFEDKAMGIAILCPFVGEYVVHGLVEDLRFMPLGLLLGMAGAYINNSNKRRAKVGEI